MEEGILDLLKKMILTGGKLMTIPKHIVSAAAIVINNKNEILLIKGPRSGWEMPGGKLKRENH